MTCSRCRARFEDSGARCPRCGTANRKASGTFQVSTVLISTRVRDHIYRSVDEVPAPLRTQLLKSTHGANSATILIADNRGRKEIARAMRHLPGAAQRRLLRAILTDGSPEGPLAWLTPVRRRAIVAVIALLALAATGLVFTTFR
jgi:hypothetical protein